MKFRRFEVVEAVRWTGENLEEVRAFVELRGHKVGGPDATAEGQ